MPMDLMEKISSLAKRRGFIYPDSEIYGGYQGFWDYGPVGTELKRNIKNEWWKWAVYMHDNVVGIDTSIIMNPNVWKASGHLDSFCDPLVECKICHKRVRADNADKIKEHEKVHDKKVEWSEPKTFNLMTEVLLGTTEPKEKAYLRGEITQGVFTNFKNIVDSTRVQIPFGVAQIGKAFRNEITPGNFTFRSREFEQMELEYFVEPDERESQTFFEKMKKERMDWYINLGIKKDNLKFRDHEENQKAHYAEYACDIEYNAPFGWSEFEGIHHRGSWDLTQHKLTYKDSGSQKEYTPWVIETSGGVDRATLFFLLDSYWEDEKRAVLKLDPRIAPFTAAVFPLVANKDELVNKAKDVFNKLKSKIRVSFDARGNIGKRYYAQDEIGTPWCITVDYDTLSDDEVTIRDRDTTLQTKVGVGKLDSWFEDKMPKQLVDK